MGFVVVVFVFFFFLSWLYIFKSYKKIIYYFLHNVISLPQIRGRGG